ncbi:hypothetical protein [Bacillus sp. CECT 9360]|uniref:hypothetical protein n=1 Tax=Bacillus sp. CECT 9360 TaxID=2845821 RepID=UPI001E3CF250|nr:hypothetical protein [Bacillus sp. CECT 9360]CAH0346797.1 hypothetical protein BCI9360_03157 [Bacillus sp. CECT 9360]
MNKDHDEDMLLNDLKNLPDYHLSEQQRSRILHNIKNSEQYKKKSWVLFNKGIYAGTICIVLSLAAFLAIILFQKEEIDYTSSNPEQEVQSGVYFDRTDKDGNVIQKKTLYGIPGRLGVLRPMEWVAEDHRNLSKMMIFLWEDQNEDMVDETLEVTGKQVDGSTSITLTETVLTSGLDSDDAHALTKFTPFSEKGEWILSFKVNGKELSSFTVDVKEAYPNSGKITVLTSGEDFHTGTMDHVAIEYKGDQLPEELEVKVSKKYSLAPSKTFIFAAKEDFTDSEGKPLSIYDGQLVFDKEGDWQIKIGNTKMNVHVKKK